MSSTATPDGETTPGGSAKRPQRRASKPKHKHKRSRFSATLELLATVVIALLIAFGVQRFLVKPFRIPSGSMIPTLIDGQRILVNRLETHPKIGQVVVFHPPTSADSMTCGDAAQGEGRSQACDLAIKAEASVAYVKRVVGVGGDHLRIIDGYVYRNGVKETGSYIQQCASAGTAFCDFPQTIVVPKGYYYMMGDNRPHSDDSRFWGPVPQKWIIGVTFFTYWPPDRIGSL